MTLCPVSRKQCCCQPDEKTFCGDELMRKHQIFQQNNIAELEELIEDIKVDLLLRADVDSEGKSVVNLSNSIWQRVKEVIEDQ